MWRSALEAGVNAVTITSYNEWGEGTQIEAARPHAPANGTAYADYLPNAPDFYMRRTREWIGEARRGCSGSRHGGARHGASQSLHESNARVEL